MSSLLRGRILLIILVISYPCSIHQFPVSEHELINVINKHWQLANTCVHWQLQPCFYFYFSLKKGEEGVFDHTLNCNVFSFGGAKFGKANRENLFIYFIRSILIHRFITSLKLQFWLANQFNGKNVLSLCYFQQICVNLQIQDK